jgi:hypothetical protein
LVRDPEVALVADVFGSGVCVASIKQPEAAPMADIGSGVYLPAQAAKSWYAIQKWLQWTNVIMTPLRTLGSAFGETYSKNSPSDLGPLHHSLTEVKRFHQCPYFESS